MAQRSPGAHLGLAAPAHLRLEGHRGREGVLNRVGLIGAFCTTCGADYLIRYIPADPLTLIIVIPRFPRLFFSSLALGRGAAPGRSAAASRAPSSAASASAWSPKELSSGG